MLQGVPDDQLDQVRKNMKTLFNPKYQRVVEQYDSDMPHNLKARYRGVREALKARGR